MRDETLDQWPKRSLVLGSHPDRRRVRGEKATGKTHPKLFALTEDHISLMRSAKKPTKSGQAALISRSSA
jgi:hypothetical protein